MLERPLKIIVAGAGAMGLQIAGLLIALGFKVTILCKKSYLGSTECQVRKKIKLIERLGKFKVVKEEDRFNLDVIDRLSSVSATPDAIIECISEDLEKKQQLFEEISSVCPSSLVISNTSVFSLNDLGINVFGLHFLNPIYKFPVVEAASSIHITPDTLEYSKTFTKLVNSLREGGLNVYNVKAHRGYVINRMLFAEVREVFNLLDAGYDYNDIREIMLSIGKDIDELLELADFVGVDTTATIIDNLGKALASPPPDNNNRESVIKEAIKHGILGSKNRTSLKSHLSNEAKSK